MLCKEELEEEGYEVDLTGDGKEVVSFLEKTAHIPDLVIMDIKMPTLDGISALRRIKEKYPDMPVILFPAYNEFKQDLAIRACNGYLIKSSD
jgi:CheY-like chemotaxis protein